VRPSSRRPSSRRLDDADVIRARLRALLDDRPRAAGWLPEEDDLFPVADRSPWALAPAAGRPGDDAPDDEATDDSDPVEDGDAEPAGIGRHRAPGTAVRLNAGRRGARSLWFAAVAAAVLVAGWTWLDRPRVEPVEQPGATAASAAETPQSSETSPPSAAEVGEAAQTAGTLVVSVVGQVVRPGLVTLPTGARVADAIAAAGGLLPGADATSVNLAAVVADGQQVAVGVPAAGGSGAGTGAGSAGTAGPVNLNTATAADLDALPGIGPVLAQRIVDYRDQQGRFAAVEQLDDVPGIGPAIYDRLAGLVTV
jgi:competence protein ComEA